MVPTITGPELRPTRIRRLRNIGAEDGCVNALIILDCFAKSVVLSVNQEMIKEIETSFIPYFE